MGDTVNLASRLEGVNKAYGTKIIISEATYAAAAHALEARELDAVRVKGKEHPVKIYELLALTGGLTDIQESMREEYCLALACYRRQEWAAAKRHCQEALALVASDTPAQVLLARVREYELDPPAEGWDGVYVMKSK